MELEKLLIVELGRSQAQRASEYAWPSVTPDRREEREPDAELVEQLPARLREVGRTDRSFFHVTVG